MPTTYKTYKGRTITLKLLGEHAWASCGNLKSRRYQGSSGERRAVAHVKRLIDREVG